MLSWVTRSSLYTAPNSQGFFQNTLGLGVLTCSIDMNLNYGITNAFTNAFTNYYITNAVSCFFLIFGLLLDNFSTQTKDHIIIGYLAQTPYFEKFFFFRYTSECSCPIRVRDSLNCNISRKNRLFVILFSI